MRNSKAQAAVEYLTVFGIALLLSTPFILKAQSSILELRTGSSVVALQNSMDKTEYAVQTVSASGEPAQMGFSFEVPKTVESGEIVNNSIVYTVKTQAGESQLIRTFESNVTGNVPEKAGKHRVKVYAKNSKTFVEVVE